MKQHVEGKAGDRGEIQQEMMQDRQTTRTPRSPLQGHRGEQVAKGSWDAFTPAYTDVFKKGCC